MSQIVVAINATSLICSDAERQAWWRQKKKIVIVFISGNTHIFLVQIFGLVVHHVQETNILNCFFI